MCYILKTIYTVCAHSCFHDLTVCAAQQARNERRFGRGNTASRFLFRLRSCHPVVQTALQHTFCDDCSNYFDGHYSIDTPDAILNYWAFKSQRGYAYPVLPQLIPADLIFGHGATTFTSHAGPRCELLALGKTWPRRFSESSAQWLLRLETARTHTLQHAEQRALARAAAASEIRRTAARLMRTPRRRTAPSQQQQQQQQQQQRRNRSALQSHVPTLQNLCGESEPLPAASDGTPGSQPPIAGISTTRRRNAGMHGSSEPANASHISRIYIHPAEFVDNWHDSCSFV